MWFSAFEANAKKNDKSVRNDSVTTQKIIYAFSISQNKTA